MAAPDDTDEYCDHCNDFTAAHHGLLEGKPTTIAGYLAK
jgi:hypothetical protein